MTTQTEQPSTTTENRQGSHHFIMTTQVPSPHGFSINSFYGTFTPLAGSTRKDAYEQIRAEHDRLYPEMAQGSVLFFSLERNEL